MNLFYCGWNGFRQVPNHAHDVISTLTEVKTTELVTAVSCSWSALCVLSGSHIYVSGFLDGAVHVSKILSLENKDSFHQVASNSKHIVALSCSKEIWRRPLGKENSKFSRISLGEITDEDSNSSVDLVKKISCSDNLFIALTNAGNIYAIPSRINDPSLVVADVACGIEHTVFVTTSGSVYSFGQGSRGQLGHGGLEAEEEAREVDALAGIKISKISCGGWHSAALSEQGDVYTWGWNRFGQLGVTPEPEEPHTSQQTDKSEGEMKDSGNEDGSGGVYALPQLIGWTEKNVVSVSCGMRHTVALLEDGTLWGCGWNAYGQLGMSPDSCQQANAMTQVPSPKKRKIERVVCGGWSTCVLVSE